VSQWAGVKVCYCEFMDHHPHPMITRDLLDNGLRLLTESMPHLRSVSIGVWLTRGSRHEGEAWPGIAHFVEHMLFKGTTSRSAEEIAQTVDSIGGQLDAFTAKEYSAYYIKVLDEHLPLAVDLLSDIVRHPAFAADDIEKEKQVVIEEIKMVEDTPDDLVHELFTQAFWEGHALGRPILGTTASVESITREALCDYFQRAYSADNVIIVAVGNLEHANVRALVERAFADLPARGERVEDVMPSQVPGILVRRKELEQCHVCLGSVGYPQSHEDRYVSYVLNTLLGGSMSSRLFQNVREKRGLAYAVFSGMSAYRDAGMLTVYAGCAAQRIDEVIDLIVQELRGVAAGPAPDAEVRRSKDHLKGSLMLGLEHTASRMSHLARQEIYFDRQFSLDEILLGIEAVTVDDITRVARDLLVGAPLSATVIGSLDGWSLTQDRLRVSS
jgi:predicted Zn-dependent peptidase